MQRGWMAATVRPSTIPTVVDAGRGVTVKRITRLQRGTADAMTLNVGDADLVSAFIATGLTMRSVGRPMELDIFMPNGLALFSTNTALVEVVYEVH